MASPFEIQSPAPSDDFDEDSASKNRGENDPDGGDLLLRVPAIDASKPVDSNGPAQQSSKDYHKTMLIAALLEGRYKVTHPDLSDQERDTLLAQTAQGLASMIDDPLLVAATSTGMSLNRSRYGDAMDRVASETRAALEAGGSFGETVAHTDVPVLSRGSSANSLVHRTPALYKTPSALLFPGQGETAYPGGITKSSSMSSMFYTLRILGQGGFGIVYHVQHKLDRSEYALKTVRLPQTADPDGNWGKACGEIRAMAKFDHDNIVRYFFSWVDLASALNLPGRGAKDEAGLTRITEEASEAVVVFGNTTATADMPDRIQEIGTSTEYEMELSNHTGNNFTNDSTGAMVDSSGHSDGISGTATGSRAVVRKVDHSPSSHTSAPALNMPRHALHVLMRLYPITLAEYLSLRSKEKYCFCPRSAAEIFEGLISGVEYLHCKNLIHRDIKPSNIFLQVVPEQPRGCCNITASTVVPKIGDFGLAAPIVALGVADERSGHEKRVGTGFYIPPEGGVHEGVDVWALGIVLFELLYKFGTTSERIIVLGELTKKGVLPLDFKSDEGAKEIILSCVSPVAKERWTLQHLKAKVQAWLAKFREDSMVEGMSAIAI